MEILENVDKRSLRLIEYFITLEWYPWEEISEVRWGGPFSALE